MDFLYWLRKNCIKCNPDFRDTNQVKIAECMNTKSKFLTAICVDSSGLHLHIAVKAAHNMSVYQVSESQKRLS